MVQDLLQIKKDLKDINQMQGIPDSKKQPSEDIFETMGDYRLGIK